MQLEITRKSNCHVTQMNLSNTLWKCSSCQYQAVACPPDIDNCFVPTNDVVYNGAN